MEFIWIHWMQVYPKIWSPLISQWNTCIVSRQDVIILPDNSQCTPYMSAESLKKNEYIKLRLPCDKNISSDYKHAFWHNQFVRRKAFWSLCRFVTREKWSSQTIYKAPSYQILYRPSPFVPPVFLQCSSLINNSISLK